MNKLPALWRQGS